MYRGRMKIAWSIGCNGKLSRSFKFNFKSSLSGIYKAFFVQIRQDYWPHLSQSSAVVDLYFLSILFAPYFLIDIYIF